MLHASSWPLSCPRFIGVLALTLTMAMATSAEDNLLISIGPRFGFSGKSPLLGKEQLYSFNLVDVAAVWRLPWSWPLGSSSWRLETRLITSAGLLEGADEKGFIATIVPDLALSAWNGLISLDAGGGAGFLSNYQFGRQDMGGPVQIVATAGIRVNPLAHLYGGFRLQHFSDAGIYGTSSLGVDMYIIEAGFRF